MKTLKFKVYCNKDGHPYNLGRKFYFDVVVRPSLKAVNEDWEKMYANDGKECGGFCSTYHRVYNFDKKGKRTVVPCLGKITLSRTLATPEVISHECAHAAFHYVKRLKLKAQDVCEQKRGKKSTIIGDAQEIYCYALGKMTEQIIVKLYGRKK